MVYCWVGSKHTVNCWVPSYSLEAWPVTLAMPYKGYCGVVQRAKSRCSFRQGVGELHRPWHLNNIQGML